MEVRISGEPRPLPAGVDVTAYRIIQEALTNALKHGDGVKAEVTVRYADHALRVEILNTGPSVLTGGRTPAAGGDGRGLLGCGNGWPCTAVTSMRGADWAAGSGCARRSRWSARDIFGS